MLATTKSIQLNLNIPAADYDFFDGLAREKGWYVQYVTVTPPAPKKRKIIISDKIKSMSGRFTLPEDFDYKQFMKDNLTEEYCQEEKL